MICYEFEWSDNKGNDKGTGWSIPLDTVIIRYTESSYKGDTTIYIKENTPAQLRKSKDHAKKKQMTESLTHSVIIGLFIGKVKR